MIIGYITTTSNGETTYIYSDGISSKCDSITLVNFGLVNGEITKII